MENLQSIGGLGICELQSREQWPESLQQSEKEAYIILSTHPDKINSSSVPWSLKLYSEATENTRRSMWRGGPARLAPVNARAEHMAQIRFIVRDLWVNYCARLQRACPIVY